MYKTNSPNLALAGPRDSEAGGEAPAGENEAPPVTGPGHTELPGGPLQALGGRSRDQQHGAEAQVPRSGHSRPAGEIASGRVGHWRLSAAAQCEGSRGSSAQGYSGVSFGSFQFSISSGLCWKQL